MSRFDKATEFAWSSLSFAESLLTEFKANVDARFKLNLQPSTLSDYMPSPAITTRDKALKQVTTIRGAIDKDINAGVFIHNRYIQESAKFSQFLTDSISEISKTIASIDADISDIREHGGLSAFQLDVLVGSLNNLRTKHDNLLARQIENGFAGLISNRSKVMTANLNVASVSKTVLSLFDANPTNKELAVAWAELVKACRHADSLDRQTKAEHVAVLKSIEYIHLQVVETTDTAKTLKSSIDVIRRSQPN